MVRGEKDLKSCSKPQISGALGFGVCLYRCTHHLIIITRSRTAYVCNDSAVDFQHLPEFEKESARNSVFTLFVLKIVLKATLS